MLQCGVVYCCVMQSVWRGHGKRVDVRVLVHARQVLECAAVWCGVMQHGAVWCRAVQCVAVWRSVLLYAECVERLQQVCGFACAGARTTGAWVRCSVVWYVAV